MRPDDRPALIDLWVASWRETMPSIDFEARRPWISAFLVDPAHLTLVADDGRARGFASLQGSLLHQFVIAPESKGGRIAVALMAAVKADAPDGLALEVNQENARAIRFYQRQGFACTGTGINANSGLPTFFMRWTHNPAA